MNISSPFSASAEPADFSGSTAELPANPPQTLLAVTEDTAAPSPHSALTMLHRAGQTGAIKTLNGSLGRYARRLPSRGL